MRRQGQACFGWSPQVPEERQQQGMSPVLSCLPAPPDSPRLSPTPLGPSTRGFPASSSWCPGVPQDMSAEREGAAILLHHQDRALGQIEVSHKSHSAHGSPVGQDYLIKRWHNGSFLPTLTTERICEPKLHPGYLILKSPNIIDAISRISWHLLDIKSSAEMNREWQIFHHIY